MADITFFYIVEPPSYQIFAARLAASLREVYGDRIKLVGYCPEHRMHELHPGAVEAQRMLGAEIRPMRTEGLFREPYPHGNKIVACLQPRDTPFSAFVDSDVLFLKDIPLEELAIPGHVSCSMAASMGWGEQDDWLPIYQAAGAYYPPERYELMRATELGPVMPYFSSGFLTFPETGFPQVWYETALAIDADPRIEHRRPYLDQMSLPIAIRRAGLDWNILPEERHYILGGRMRGKSLPDDRNIYCVHYRHRDILKEIGLEGHARSLTQRWLGTSWVRRLSEKPESVEAVETPFALRS